MAVVGFDFGTTNSLISVVVGDRTIDVVDEGTGMPFPSVVRYEGEEKIVGSAAKDMLDAAGLGVHGNTVRSPKTLLGQETVIVGGVPRSPVDIVHDVVEHVKRKALEGPQAAALDGVTRAVVTIPISMDGPRRAGLRDAFRRADISIVQFVHEPFAALYGYLRSDADMAGRVRELNRRNILVVDWGGGTLDITLCRLEHGRLVQLGNSGSDEVGGDVFDEVIRNEVIHRFRDGASMDPEAAVHPDALTRLLHDSELHKIALSSRSSATFYRPGFLVHPDVALEYELTRDAMDEMTRPLVAAGVRRITSLLDSVGIGPAQVSMCLVTGGMAAMPAIRVRLHELFGPQRVHVSDSSSTLIAKGAAWIAHDRQKLRLAKSIELRLARGAYVTALSAGMEMPDERQSKRDQLHLYCSDPRDGFAKFEICTPASSSTHVQLADPRVPLANLAVRVDPRTLPLRERLELDITVNDDLIVEARARSTEIGDEDSAKIHSLEFALSLPSDTVDESGGGAADPFDSAVVWSTSPGDLVLRSNITLEQDESLVPGELLHSYKPGYFDRRARPPQVQVEEWLYYQPCAVCGSSSSDARCRCATGPNEPRSPGTTWEPR